MKKLAFALTVGLGFFTGVQAAGGVQDHNSWTNYFKPYPPDNAIVKVKVAGASDYGTPDRDHKYCLDGYWDGGAAGIEVRLLYKTQEGYLFPDSSTTNFWTVTVTNNAQEVYPPAGVVAIRSQAKCGSTDYLTLRSAVDAAKSRARIELNGDVTLDETLTLTNSVTLDLNTKTLTLGSALTEAFHFTAGGTVSNGTIQSSLAANVEGSVLMRFTDCKATLRNLTINGEGYETVVRHDSEKSTTDKSKANRISAVVTCDDLTLTGNGCLLSVDSANATLTNACAFTITDTPAPFGTHQAAIFCTSNGTVSIVGGTYVAPTVLLAEDFGVFYKSDNVILAAPDGYVWENGRLVAGAAIEPVTPGVASESYADALSATNAVVKINANKGNCISVPTGVEGTAKMAYLSRIEATVTSDNRVVVDLMPAAAAAEQTVLDTAITSTVVATSLVCADLSAKVTVEKTTPGLYYWIMGGTDVNAITNAGAGVLSTAGGPVELVRPTLDATAGRAFFRIAAGVKKD